MDVNASEKSILSDEERAQLEQCYASAEAAPEILDIVVKFAIGASASDLLFEPHPDFGYVRTRIDGILYLLTKIPTQFYASVVSRIKIMATLDITVHNGSQEGKIMYEYTDRLINLRVAVTRVVNGELVVMRLHDSNTTVYPLDMLGLQAQNLDAIKQLLKYKSGLILTCGPTGSGKTSTLYSALQSLNLGTSNIISVEDPVEFILPGINQMQVDKEHGMNFADGLRVILRLNPDIIFVGEIRDPETAHIAIESALTGHLVLSTMHANSSIGAISRLLDLGVEKFFLNAAFAGVVSQRLVRRICPSCITEAVLNEEEAQFYQHVTGQSLPSQAVGAGCHECSMTGYKGRIGVYEVLSIDDTIRTLISHGANEELFKEALKQKAFTSLVQDGLSKVEQRLTTVQEVMTNVYIG